MSSNAKITEADYCLKEEAAKIMKLTPEEFSDRLRWGRGPRPVGRDRDGQEIWVREMVRRTSKARADGHIV